MPSSRGSEATVGRGALLYCLWATLAIGLSIARAGLSPESITRLLVIAFLLAQLVWRSRLVRAFPGRSPRVRFLLLGTLLAAAVEGFHMISVPVFRSLRITRDTPLAQGAGYYAIDLLLTVPAYLVIFSVIWEFIRRYRFTLWQYVLAMGLGQALGDGGLIFFAQAPVMLLFLPYPMTNYHAINVIPFLSVRDRLEPDRPTSPFRYLAVPGVIVTYFVCGAIIRLVGRAVGLGNE